MTKSAGRTYTQLMAQITGLQKEAEAIRKAEVAGVVSRIKDAIKTYGLSASDLGFGAPAKAKTAKKAATGRNGKTIRYKDDKGNGWVGLGKRPRWLQEALASGKKLEDFKVA